MNKFNKINYNLGKSKFWKSIKLNHYKPNLASFLISKKLKITQLKLIPCLKQKQDQS